MALGDTPNQTKKPKNIKAPAINQLRAGGAGGDSTASAGSNNMNNIPINKSGIATPLVAPSKPVLAQPQQMETVNIGGMSTTRPVTPNLTPNRGTNPSLTQLDKPVLAGNIDVPKPMVPMESPKPLDTISSLTPSTSQQAPTPNLGQVGGASYMTNQGGIKTLNTAGGTISSSSPNFGNSSPQRLADLDKTIANSADPERQRLRAESAALADQRYNDAYRNGLSRAEYEDPNGVTQIGIKFEAAKARGDRLGAGGYLKLLQEQMGNQTALAGQRLGAESNQSAAQLANAKLGYEQFKDERNFEATQANKGLDQSLDVQKSQASIEKNVSDLINNPNYMNESKSPSQTFSDVDRLGGDVAKSIDSILGPQTANAFRSEKDINKRAQLLQGMGLSPDQVKMMLMRYQQQ